MPSIPFRQSGTFLDGKTRNCNQEISQFLKKKLTKFDQKASQFGSINYLDIIFSLLHQQNHIISWIYKFNDFSQESETLFFGIVFSPDFPFSMRKMVFFFLFPAGILNRNQEMWHSTVDSNILFEAPQPKIHI